MSVENSIDSAFEKEIDLANQSKVNGFASEEWNHLERAHILGQFYALKHLYVHVLMIGYSVRHKLVREFLGQIPRIMLAVPGSILKLAPKGNTGGADVGIFEPMQIPDDLQKILNGTE